MSLQEPGIIYKRIESTPVACIRFNLKARPEIREAIQEIACALPQENVNGDPYCIMQYFSSYPEGFEVEVGFPVRNGFETKRIKSKTWPALEVLSLIHQGSPEALSETRNELVKFTRQKGLISDEFTREVYLDWQDPQGAIEAQFVIHNWNALLACNLERVLGKDKHKAIMDGAEEIGIETNLPERFTWVKGAIGRLNTSANERQKYDIVSSCAHVFPLGQLDKLKAVYDSTHARNADPIQSVDAVLAFMASDPGWGEHGQYRQDRIIYHTKNPADPHAFELAKTPEEKRAAYCFCPIIRNNLGKGMSDTFCYCGSGWYRQQWEEATGKPVIVEVIKSVIRGDDVCQFAVHLSDDL